MTDSRTWRSIKNIAANVGYQVFFLLINFLSRTVFVHVLGAGYLGISSLFSNILTVLSLAELGIGTSMTYCLYDPLSKNDTIRLAQLVQYFKKIYQRIAVIILISGMALIPFLGYVIQLDQKIQYIRSFYVLYLVDTVFSYLCVYKTLILTADQKDYVLKGLRMMIELSRSVIQMLIIIVWKSYFFYIIIQIIGSLITNLVSAICVDRRYPYINDEQVQIQEDEKKSIWSNVRSMFSYKIGGVILNNTDQLLISILVNTETVGLYSNYYLPIRSVMGVTSVVFIAVQASIGNLVVEKDQDHQYEIFNMLDICSFCLYGVCFVCFCVLLQDFIILWLGREYLLSDTLVYVIASTYYLTGILYPIWCYRETIGLFHHTKNVMLYASALNLIFSVLLGKQYGIEGILAATVIARIMTNIWFEPYKLFTIYFRRSVISYYIRKIMQVVLLVVLTILLKHIVKMVEISDKYVCFLFRCMICFGGSSIVVFLSVFKNESFKKIVKNIVR